MANSSLAGSKTDKIAFQMKEAAVAAGICKAKLYQEIKAGRLKSAKVCGRRLILRDDLEAFLRAPQAQA
jgi:excisionase family DNA binding protein